MDKRYEIATQFVGHYRPISSEGIKALAQVMEPVTLAKGETFVCEGDVVRYIYYIEKGMVRQFYFKNKRDLIAVYLGINDFRRAKTASEFAIKYVLMSGKSNSASLL